MNEKPILPWQNQSLETSKRTLTQSEFQWLSEIPWEHEWFANLKNEHTKRAYRRDIGDFIEFTGLGSINGLRMIQRSHVIAYSDELERRWLSPASTRRKLSALSSLYEYLCSLNAVALNPVTGVKRNTTGANQGNTPSLGDDEVKRLLASPDISTPRGLRDRALICLFLHEWCRRGAVNKLKVRDIHYDQGVPHIRFHEKREKKFSVMLHPNVQSALFAYMTEAGNSDDLDAPLFLSTKGKEFVRRPLSSA